MIRQARAYLVGAVSGTMLVGVAIAVFVLLVSLQVFRDWPVAGLGGGGDAAAVESRSVSGGGSAAEAAAGGETAAAGGGGGANVGGASGGSGGAASPAGGEETVAAPGDGSAGNEGRTGASSSGGGGGSGGSETPAGGGSGGSGSTSEQVTDTVNDVVSGVDETVLGGTLEETGVTGATENALDDVAGPDSAAGKVVDRATDTVDGLLGGDR